MTGKKESVSQADKDWRSSWSTGHIQEDIWFYLRPKQKQWNRANSDIAGCHDAHIYHTDMLEAIRASFFKLHVRREHHELDIKGEYHDKITRD